jgi:hypothetical protein
MGLLRAVLLTMFGAIGLVGLVGCGGEDPVVGMWELDTDHAVDTMMAALEEQMGDVPDFGDMPEGMPDPREMMRSQFEGIDASFVVNADGTFDGRSRGPDGSEESISGTWVATGSSYTFTTDDEDTMTMTLRDGMLWFSPEPDTMDAEWRLMRESDE